VVHTRKVQQVAAQKVDATQIPCSEIDETLVKCCCGEEEARPSRGTRCVLPVVMAVLGCIV
jgi:hypothetical protein